jgi:hypothetical protein
MRFGLQLARQRVDASAIRACASFVVFSVSACSVYHQLALSKF